jgi:hypothetical protein
MTRYLMEGAILGEADVAAGGAEGGIRLDAALGIDTGGWAREGGSPGGHINGGVEILEEDRAAV